MGGILNMNKKIMCILLCSLFFGAITCSGFSIFDEVGYKVEINDFNNFIGSAMEIDFNSDNNWSEQAKLLASDGEADDWFGFSVAVDDDTAIIGAPTNDDDIGQAYIFTRSGTVWTEQAKLLASDGEAGDWFGLSVSLDGDTAIIGAPYDNDNGDFSGSAYIFERSGTVWTEQAKLLASDGDIYDRFGYSVSIDRDTAIIGAPFNIDYGNESGSVYMFIRNGKTWIEQIKLKPSDGGPVKVFGFSVSLEGEKAIIGDPIDENNGAHSGSAYIFIRNNTTWTEQTKLLPSDGTEGDAFGNSVSIDGDTVIIGAEDDDDNENFDGSVYIFTRNETTWTEQAKLLAPDNKTGNGFGCSVSLDGNTVLIGTTYDEDSGYESGSAILFIRNGETWVEQAKLIPSDGEDNTGFGLSVSLDGDTAIIGAFVDNDNGEDSGSAYIFVNNLYGETELKISIKRGLRRSVKVIIENIGLVDANDLTWNINVTRRGFFKRTVLDISGNISILEKGVSEIVFDRPFGFGFIKFTVNVSAPGMDPIEKTVKGFIFLRFIRLRRFF